MLNFLVTGCSFTAGAIPLPNDTYTDWKLKSSVWPHFCFMAMGIENRCFQNLAMPGSGNIAAMTNLVLWLEKHRDQLQPDNTLVGFNISEHWRWDTPCSVQNPLSNKDQACMDDSNIVHPSETLGLAWITHALRHADRNLDNVNMMSACCVLNCFCYLESRGFDYFFMVMNDSIIESAPDFLQSALQQRQNRWIKFEGISGMAEFCHSHNMITADGHPTVRGHQFIASKVMHFLEQNHAS